MPQAFVIYPTGEITIKTPEGLEEFKELVGGYIQYLPYPEREDVACYINEEGKLQNLPLNEQASKIMSPVLFDDDCIVGPMIVIGFDPDTGEEKDCPIGIKDLINE